MSVHNEHNAKIALPSVEIKKLYCKWESQFNRKNMYCLYNFYRLQHLFFLNSKICCDWFLKKQYLRNKKTYNSCYKNKF